MTAHRSPTLRRRHHNRPRDDTPLRRRSRPGWMLVETAAGLGVLLVIMTTFMLATRDWTRAAASSHVKETTTDILNSALAPASTIDCADPANAAVCKLDGDGIKLETPDGHETCIPTRPPPTPGIPTSVTGYHIWDHLQPVSFAFVWACVEPVGGVDQLTVKWHTHASRQKLETQSTHPRLGLQPVLWNIYSSGLGGVPGSPYSGSGLPGCNFAPSHPAYANKDLLVFRAPSYRGSGDNAGVALASDSYALHDFRAVQTGIPASQADKCEFAVQARDQYNFSLDEPNDPIYGGSWWPNCVHGYLCYEPTHRVPGGRQLVIGAVNLRATPAEKCGSPGDPDPNRRYQAGTCTPDPAIPYNSDDLCPDNPHEDLSQLKAKTGRSMLERLQQPDPTDPGVPGRDVLYCSYVYDWHEFGDKPDGPDADSEPDMPTLTAGECRGLDDFKVYSVRKTLILAFTIEQPDYPFTVDGSVRREALPADAAWTARPGGDLTGHRLEFDGTKETPIGWLSTGKIGDYPQYYGQGPSAIPAADATSTKPFAMPPPADATAKETVWKNDQPTTAHWPAQDSAANSIHPQTCVPIVGEVGAAVTWCTGSNARRDLECQSDASKWVTPFWLAVPGWNEPPNPLKPAAP